jgi:hypothetical protein
MDGESTLPGQEPEETPAEGASTEVVPPPPIDLLGQQEVAVAPPPPGASLVKRGLIALGAFVVVGGIAALAIAFVALRGTGDVIDQMVPGNITVYVTVYLDPALKQKLNLRDLAKKFPDLADSEILDRRIDQALDQVLNETGLKAKDIRPWLGSQVALAVRWNSYKPLGAFLVASKDDPMARAALAKLRAGPQGSSERWTEETHGGVVISIGYRGAELDGAYAMIDHTVVLGDPVMIKDIIDASQGKAANIGDSDRFTGTVASLPTERLALAYVDFGPLLGQIRRAIEAGGGPDLSQISSSFGRLDAFSGLGATLSAQPEGMALDLTFGFDRSKLTADQREILAEVPHQNSVLSFTPKDAYGVLAATGFRQTIQAAIDEFKKSDPAAFADLDAQVGLSQMVGHLSGDFGVEVSPGTESSHLPAGALLIDTSDDSGMRTFLDHVASLVTEELAKTAPRAPSSRFLHQTYRGVDVSYLSGSELSAFGVIPAYAVTDGTAIVGSSLEEVEAIIDARTDGMNVTSAPNLVAATSADELSNNGMMYLDLEAIIRDVRSALPPDELARFDASGGSNLGPLKAFILAARNGSDHTDLRMFLLVR